MSTNRNLLITLDRDLRAIIGRNCYDVLFELVDTHNYLTKHCRGYNGTFEYPIERLSVTSQVGKKNTTKEAVRKLESGIVCPDSVVRRFISVSNKDRSNKNYYTINATSIKEATRLISQVKFTYEYGYQSKTSKRPTKAQTIKAIRRTILNFNEKEL